VSAAASVPLTAAGLVRVLARSVDTCGLISVHRQRKAAATAEAVSHQQCVSMLSPVMCTNKTQP
jgi:hypothetical protein